jgi:DNA polymerase-3 subunit gamma/tau
MAKRKFANPEDNAVKPPEAAGTQAPGADEGDGYTVLARRYRPQSFADLVGQEPVAQSLINALQSGRVAHAYLFTGARGVGKTSMARILAKALNCTKGPTATPCNECDSCVAIAAGDDVDVLEIDAASNTGVENVREIRSNVQYRPSRSRYKIYIVDEVHMLSKNAFNALLKTLEEPPPHVKFIFATTEVDKIPITILSRCQRFDFAGIGTPRIVQRLGEISRSEGMEADPEALEMVARRAGGSMRDAQSLLDQLLAFGGGRLTTDQIHQLLGTASDDRIDELAAAALDKEPRRALELLEYAAGQGLQLGELVDQLILYWRDLMVVRCAGADGPGISIGSKHKKALVERAQKLTLDSILAGLDILSTTRARLRTSNHGRILVEMALVRLGRLEDLLSLSQLAEAIDKGAIGLPSPPSGISAVGEGSKKKHLTSGEPILPNAPIPAPAAVGPTPLTPDSLPNLWSRVLTELGSMLRFQLDQCGIPAISGPNTLVMRIATGYNPGDDPESVARIEALLLKFTGQKCQFRIEMGSAPPDASANKIGAGTSSREPENTKPRSPKPREEAVDPPLVKWAEEILGAKVVRKDPGFGASALAHAERAAPRSGLDVAGTDAEEP